MTPILAEIPSSIAIDSPPEEEPLTEEDRRVIALAELFNRRHRVRTARAGSRKQPEFVLRLQPKQP